MKELEKAPVKFKQHDISRALKAASCAGLNVSRVDIETDGRLTLIFSSPPTNNLPLSAFDAWKINQNARQT